MYTQRYQLPPIKKQMIRSELSTHKQQKKPKIGQYIDNSLRKIQVGCYNNGKLWIDGGYGDYRMAIFRLKDRRKKFFQIPSIFTQEFVKEVQKRSPPELKQQFHRIIKAKNQDYLRKQDQNSGSQSMRPKVAVWNNQQEEYLYHEYVPKYQKQKWFKKTLSLPQVQQPKKQQIVVQTIKQQAKKGRSKRKQKDYFFKHLNNSNKSTFFVNST